MPPVSIGFLSISLESWLTIAAILIGPLMALLIQKKLETIRTSNDRKIAIFRSLMANRASRTSAPFVQALNGIEVEFYGQTQVLEAWRSLNEHLYQKIEPLTEADVNRWNDGVSELVIELLYKMGESLGYHFDKVALKRNAYLPALWSAAETENLRIRQSALKVFEGDKPLKIEITGGKPPQ